MTKVILLRSINNISKSCEYMTIHINENTPIIILFIVNIMLLFPKNIYEYVATASNKIYKKQVTRLNVLGRNLRYWMFHGRMRIRMRPIIVVRISVHVGNLSK